MCSCSDLHISDHQADTFQQKLARARFALARSDGVRSVSGSIPAKYKKAAPIPVHLVNKSASQADNGKNNIQTSL